MASLKFCPQSLGNGSYNHKITDWCVFAEFAKKHGEKPLSEMSRLWSNISRKTIHKALKNWAYTQKKTHRYKERDEEKRAKFKEVIARKDAEDLVYIDEFDIDNTEDYPYGYCKKGQRFHALKAGRESQRISMIAAL